MAAIAGEDKMADAQDSTTTALAIAPLQGQVVQPWETMKPVSYEMAMMMPGEQFYARMEKVGEFTRFFQGAVRETILHYRDELRAAQNRYKRGEHFVPGCKTWQEAVPVRFGFSYSYMREVWRGGRKPRRKAKALPKAQDALPPQGGVDVTSEPVVQASLTGSPTPVTPSVTDTMPDLVETLAKGFKAAFSKAEGLEESLRRFFAGMDDDLLTEVAEAAYSVIGERRRQKQEEKAREAIAARTKAAAAPKLTWGHQGTKEAMDRIAGILQGSPEDNDVDCGAFKPAVPVGDGDGDGCEPPQEHVPGCKVPVLGQEAHGTDSLEVTEAADAGGLPPATPGGRKRAKHLPVPIVLEDGRSGHVIAGMGDRTKRTMYGVRLEDGGRAEVRKRLYATPANLAGLCLVPKAWLVDGEAPLEKVPEFLKGQVPAPESEGMEY